MKRHRLLARLTGLVLVAALVPTAALIAGGIYLNRTARAQMEQQSQETLNLAINLEQSLIDGRLSRVRDRAAILARQPQMATALAGTAPARALLDPFALPETGTDLILLVDRLGRVVGRSGADVRGDIVSYGGLLSQTIVAGEAVGNVIRIPGEELGRESPALLQQVRIGVQPTEGASDPRAGSELTDALALTGAAPVRDPGGAIVGAVLVSDILNNDPTIVDDVSARSPMGMPLHATIALDGVRVTTNVPAPGGGRRAVGTLYSDAVMQQLRAGREYRGRALVGGWQWERSIYVPLFDQAGRVVGGSFVGVPEQAFTALTERTNTLTQIAMLIGLLSLLGAGTFAFFMIRESVVRPLERLAGELGGSAGHLAAQAAQTAAGATEAMTVAAGALAAAERAGAGARAAATRARELELSLARVGGGTEEQARAVRHAGAAIGQVGGAVADSRRVLDEVLESTRAAVAAVQQGRHSALQALAALEVARLAAARADESTAGGLAADLDRGRAAADECDRALHQAARAAEAARAGIWDMAAVLNESGAQVGAVSSQLSDISAVADEIAAHVATGGEAGRLILADVAAAEAGTDVAHTAIEGARGHMTRIAESHEALQDLSDRINALARELGERFL